MTGIIIVMDGGLIQDVLVSDPAIEVRVIDYDIEGYDGHVCSIPQRDGTTEEAVVINYCKELNPQRVAELVKVIDDHLEQVKKGEA